MKLIVEELERIRQIALNATQTAIDDATDDETVSQNRYDTLALEAAYLAHGQAVRVKECESDIIRYKNLPVRQFEHDEHISTGALVELADEHDKSYFFYLGPCAGGVTVSYQGETIALITAQAPLGKAMLGKQVDDEVVLDIANRRISYEILSIN